jgi:excisionase family DNA binding protein
MAEMSVSLPELMTVQDFLHNFSVGKTTFYREVEAGRLRIVKIGRSTRVTRLDAMDWLQNLKTSQREHAS